MQKQKLLIKDNMMQNQYHVNNDISEYDTKSTFNEKMYIMEKLNSGMKYDKTSAKNEHNKIQQTFK